MSESVTYIKTIKLNASTVSLRSDGIMHFVIKSNIQFTLKDAQEIVEAAGIIGEGKKYLNLISAGKYTLPEKEVRDFSAGEKGSKYTIAGAFVVTSLAQKILGNSYILFNKPITPTRIFNSESEALMWLKGFKQE